jgi:transposase
VIQASKLWELAMYGHGLTDFEWRVIEPLLPNKPRGVPRVDDRRLLNGIFWVLRTDSLWRVLPTAVRPAYDLLQPLRAVVQGRCLGSGADGRDRGLRRRRANDRHDDGAGSSACRELNKSTRIAVWAARAAD